MEKNNENELDSSFKKINISKYQHNKCSNTVHGFHNYVVSYYYGLTIYFCTKCFATSKE